MRLTGGEPSLRRDVTDIIAAVRENDAIRQIAVTTNGYRLERDVANWRDAGLTGINVSVDSLDARIGRTEETIQTMLRKADKAFLIYHPALTYFARDYGLKQICIEEEGKEPSPSRLQELVREAREADVRVVFIQQEFDTRNAQMMAEETGTKPVVINPLGYDWEKEMINITRALARQTPVE